MFVPLLTVALSALLGGRPPGLQEAKPVPRLELAQSVGPPGGIVAVPIQLSAVDAVQLGALTVKVRFPASRLTFTKVEIGGLGESVGAKATATTQRRGAETELEVTIATPESQGARTPLPGGPIAQLMFTVGKNLKPETVISLKLEATGRGVEVGNAPVSISARASEIIVSNPSVISCFFYMH